MTTSTINHFKQCVIRIIKDFFSAFTYLLNPSYSLDKKQMMTGHYHFNKFNIPFCNVAMLQILSEVQLLYDLIFNHLLAFEMKIFFTLFNHFCLAVIINN